MPEIPSIEERMNTLLRNVAERIRPCRACEQEIAFVRHSNGNLAPYTFDGVNHFVNCPQAEEFRRRRRSHGIEEPPVEGGTR